jgi:proline iminopeptidase
MARTRTTARVRVLLPIGISMAVLAGPSAGQVARPATSGARADADSGTIISGGFRLGYRIEGTGRPAIVIGSAVYYPRVFSQGLRKHLRLVFLDHRGFAPAPPGIVDKSAFALDKLVDDVERARQELGLGKIAVIGHSGHAFMALEYAKKYPANVSHVIMIGIAPDLSVSSWLAAGRHWQESASPERKAALQDNVRRMPDAVLEKLPSRERFVKRYVRDGPRAWYDPHFDASPLWAGVEINVEMFEYVWGQVFRDIEITRGLSGFDRPVFLALGRCDFIVAPPSSWDRIRPKFKDLTVGVFDRSGHTPPY